jgi:vancomycin resistance protein YoaR
MKKAKRSVTTTVCVIVALCVCYLIFCGIIGKKKFFPNTSINGIDVSNMTVKEAAAAVEDQFATEYNNAGIDVTLEGKTYCIAIEEALDLNVIDAVQQANDVSHGFLTRGFNFIKALFGEAEYTARPSLKDKKPLYTAIEQSGLTKLEGVEDSSYTVKDDKVIVTKGRGGYTVDSDKLADEIASCISKGEFDAQLECPLTYSDVDLDLVYDQIYVAPADATLDPENDYSVTDSVVGISFDKDAARKKLDAAADGEEVSFDLVYTEPELSKETLQAYLFRDTLGSFSTNVGGTDARKGNVAKAAENCNGTILMPGEEFSFNNVVGQRTIENGFQAAPSYVNGESVDEVGGGICQVSSTLYDACLYANLEIAERHCHPHPSTYVDAGFDATVSWGGPDYRFINNTDYPLKVTASYSGGVVSCAIYGTKLKDFRVSLSSELVATYDYDTEYEDDDTLEKGEEEVSVTGITGTKYQTYRTVYDGNGEVISSEPESVSVYDKRDKVVLRGTKEKEDTSEENSTEEKKTEEKTTEEKTTEDTTEKKDDKKDDSKKDDKKSDKKSDNKKKNDTKTDD